jgi:Restriction Enzyme Adenine Methylase Associated
MRMEKKKFHESFRKIIMFHKNDIPFFEKHVPDLELLLSNALIQIKSYKNDLSEFNSKPNKNKPDKDIIELIRQGILNTESNIIGEHNGKEFVGHLTEDGYIELEINGNKRKFGSLRRAVITVWGRDTSSQWKFWKVKNDKGEQIDLEYYKNQI